MRGPHATSPTANAAILDRQACSLAPGSSRLSVSVIPSAASGCPGPDRGSCVVDRAAVRRPPLLHQRDAIERLQRANQHGAGYPSASVTAFTR